MNSIMTSTPQDNSVCSNCAARNITKLYEAAATALNNMSVSLISQGAYKQSLATLREAMLILRASSSLQNTEHTQCETNSYCDINQILQHAKHRFAHPEIDVPVSSQTTTRVKIITVLDQSLGSLMQIRNDQQESSSCSSSVVCMRIKEPAGIEYSNISSSSSHLDSCLCRDVREDSSLVEMVTIFHNVAIAYWGMSNIPKLPMLQANKFRQNAVKFHKISHAFVKSTFIAEKQCQSDNDSTTSNKNKNNKNAAVTRIILVPFTVVQQRIRCFTQAGTEQQQVLVTPLSAELSHIRFALRRQ